MQLQLPEYAGCLFEPSRYKVLHGGRGGAKSWAIAIALLSIGMNRPIRVLCARELQVSIADSVHKLLSDIIASHEGMTAFYEVQNKSILGCNGTEFSFKGLKHNANEIKSYEGVDYCWVEEAQAVSDKSWEILIPTIRKENSEIWICFNPKNITDPTWQRFVIDKDDDVILRHVGWQHNPFFPAVLEKERVKLLAKDPEAYKHIWDGGFDTRYSGCVYAKWVDTNKLSPQVLPDPAFPIYTAWDLGYDDTTAIWFYQIGGGELFIVDYFESNLEDIIFYCEALYGRKIIVEHINPTTKQIERWHFGEDIEEHAHRKNYNYHLHYVPHDAGYKTQAASGRDMVTQAKEVGVKLNVIPAASHQANESALRLTLPKCWINTERCRDGLHALMSYHYEYDEDRKIFKKEPDHDWSSHAADAAELMARMWIEKPITQVELNKRAQVNKFHRLRDENNLNRTDPYRVKPMRKK